MHAAGGSIFSWSVIGHAANVRRFRIYRLDPESDRTPRLDTYEIDADACDNTSVLVAISLTRLPFMCESERGRKHCICAVSRNDQLLRVPNRAGVFPCPYGRMASGELYARNVRDLRGSLAPPV
jgi:hypothetical protein